MSRENNARARERKIMRRKKRRAFWAFWGSLLLRVILILCLTLVLALQLMFVGPSRSFSDQLTLSMMESSALKFVPYLFLREEAVSDILNRGAVQETDEETDTSLITIAAAPTEEETQTSEFGGDGIALYPVTGGSYKGYMMIVQDPSRVFLGVVSDNFGSNGKTIDKICEKYNAVGGINASGFEDKNGLGNGGTPLGLVVSEGTLLRNGSSQYTSAAFDENNILHVGKFTREDVEALHLRDAAGWGPALVQNGAACEVTSTSTGLNPRTAIGQRADGAVLMLVIDGRHANSLGASYADLISVMMEYGAVNACNLDGGYSSIMYYNNERVSDVTTMARSRSIPNAFLIRRQDHE